MIKKNIIKVIIVYAIMIHSSVLAVSTTANKDSNITTISIHTLDEEQDIHKNNNIIPQHHDHQKLCKQINTLEISEAWARASISSNHNSTSAYMLIHNPTNQQIIILGASSPIAHKTELYKSFIDEKGVTRRAALDRIVVPANSSIYLDPGGIYVMLVGVKKKLITSNQFLISLLIEDMDAITVETTVK